MFKPMRSDSSVSRFFNSSIAYTPRLGSNGLNNQTNIIAQRGKVGELGGKNKDRQDGRIEEKNAYFPEVPVPEASC